MTAVIAVLASGRKILPFFIVQEKRDMSAWSGTLSKNAYGRHMLF